MSLPTAIVDQITRRAFISTELVEIGLPTPVYITSAPYDIKITTPTSNGEKTFIAQGSFLNFTGINTIDTIRVNNIALTFSGATNFYINLVLNDNYLHRPVRIYKLFLEQNQVVSNGRYTYVPPILMYQGIMTGGSVDETDKESVVTINTSNQFYDFDRTNGRKTNSASQKRYFPLDKGLDYSTAAISDVDWGRKTT